MTTYYVRKTGNDGNDGSDGSPWLTLAYADSQMVDGDVCVIGDGTYAEETSGLGYWSLLGGERTPNGVTFQSESEDPTAVTITGVSGTHVIRTLAACDGYHFLNVSVAAHTASVTDLVYMYGSLTTQNFSFTNVRFVSHTSSTGLKAIDTTITAGRTQTGLTFTNCNLVVTGASTAVFAQFGNAIDVTINGLNAAGNVTTLPTLNAINPSGDWSITNSIISSTAEEAVFLGDFVAAGTLVFSRNICTTDTATSTEFAVIIVGGFSSSPIDGAVIENNTITATNGSGLEIRNYMTNLTVRNNTATTTGVSLGVGTDGTGWGSGDISGIDVHQNTCTAADHGILIGRQVVSGNVYRNTTTSSGPLAMVLKCANVDVYENYIKGVTGSALRPKGSRDTTIRRNYIEITTSGAAILTDEDDVTHPAGNLTLTDNRILVGGTADAYDWDTDGGNTLDRNCYWLDAGAGWGTWEAVALSSFADLQTESSGEGSGKAASDAAGNALTAEQFFALLDGGLLKRIKYGVGLGLGLGT